MSDLITLLVRHALAACGGWFAANNITGDSTTSIIIGLGILGIPVVWSWVVKVCRLDDELSGGITDNRLVRIMLGAIASQAVTALSTYLAVDANNPELLLGALINAALSKAGLHQKLAFMGSKEALKLAVLSLSVLSLASCSLLQGFALRNQGAIEEMVIYGIRSGVQAGFRKLDAKQPRNVQPLTFRAVRPTDRMLPAEGSDAGSNPARPACFTAASLAQQQSALFAIAVKTRVQLPQEDRR